ncbi:anthranilate phosphoribosyltransferase [Paenibacillus swuensis]|uniref:Anthranilate phosphoribosyltransferase n=1 Tax=Paenibacillus swuensis TaxID=1178515 RepID=A0A172TM30_9BACL|nr:anthranilate phosphoribosyltransferase [Paenibacillus swuensis]ANE47964.1 anthranilate phosphoribosyltransferase [Paenibacillus swuensis]
MERAFSIQQAIAKMINGAHLTRQEAQVVMSEVMDGEATSTQIGSLLTALRMKGETIDEITGFAETMRLKSNRVHTIQAGLLDTCGTGGSGMHKFNISTASAIIAASQGVRVAKHGNRAMSGRTGSADVLEALGVNIGINSEQAAGCLNEIGLCFLFAQLYHPSMKHAAAPRKELGFRTVFNLLGPLTNPAGADRQLMGIFDRSRTETVARVLEQLQVKRALVVGSHDGLDEISISAPTRISELNHGIMTTYEVTPESLGLRSYAVEAIAGGTPEVNANIIRNVFSGEQGAYRDIVLANAGACIYLADQCASLREGVVLAGAAIDSGAAKSKLDQLIQYTGELSHVS